MPDQTTPTPRQREVLTALAKYIDTHNQNAPSIRELCDLCDIASTANVRFHLENLAKQGLITFQRCGDDPHSPIAARSYRPTAAGLAALKGVGQ